MRTFIEQKQDTKAEILALEREIESLYDKIDKNELRIVELERTLAMIGKEITDD